MMLPQVRISLRDSKGSVFVFVLWAIFLLAMMAVALASASRQKIIVYERLRDRDRIRCISESAICTAIGGVESQAEDAGPSKSFSYEGESFYNDEHGSSVVHVSDESARIQINRAEQPLLKKFLMFSGRLSEREAEGLSREIIDYRDTDDFVGVANQGGSEKNAYRQAQLAYGPKNGLFEMPEELLLVKGMTKETYNLLRPYITIYGDGLLNINTCSREVFLYLDLEPETVDKILLYRRGPDSLEQTSDDRVFRTLAGILPEIKTLDGWSENDSLALAHAIEHGQIGVSSQFFRIESRATLKNRFTQGVTVCIYGINDGIRYWCEA